MATGTPCYDDLNPCTTDACDAAGICAHPPAGAGLPCLDDANACTTDVCDAAGVCTHPALPDADGDGLCDALDECPQGVALTSARVKIGRFSTGPGDDRLAVRGQLTLPVPITPPIDPVSHGVRLLIRDAAGGSAGGAFLDVTVPAGAYSESTGTGWAVKGGSRFLFRSPQPVGGAVRAVRLQLPPTIPGRVRVAITGTEGSFVSGVFALPPRVTVLLDPPATPSVQCAEATSAAAQRIYQAGATTIVCR